MNDLLAKELHLKYSCSCRGKAAVLLQRLLGLQVCLPSLMSWPSGWSRTKAPTPGELFRLLWYFWGCEIASLLIYSHASDFSIVLYSLQSLPFAEGVTIYQCSGHYYPILLMQKFRLKEFMFLAQDYTIHLVTDRMVWTWDISFPISLSSYNTTLSPVSVHAVRYNLPPQVKDSDPFLFPHSLHRLFSEITA